MEIIDKICEKARKIASEKSRCIIAIDGRCGSGKSTLARILAEKLSVQVVYMDDFFLPFPLRTEERMNEAGGNIHYERFIDEVINHLDDEALTYGVFDCSVMKINGESHIENNGVIIIEGSYALHDKFGKYYDFAIFSDVDYDTQVERIRARNGEEMLKRFTGEWIPMEEKYFAAQKTAEKCDFVIKSR
ncbi:MAG: (d)CMP kinase [Clostridia bacterium]|nr:(d)CMP kinase [Clostridia bacterium]